MRYLVIFFSFSLSLVAQNDTLFKTDRSIIPCSITYINKHTLYYIDVLKVGQSSPLPELVAYSLSGKRTMVNIKMPAMRLGPTDSVNITDELAHMRDCFSKFHKQYSTGISITLVGGALAVTSTFIKGDETVQSVLGIGGMVMMVIGAATVIDAHKYFSKAGWGLSGKGNSAGVRYRFK